MLNLNSALPRLMISCLLYTSRCVSETAYASVLTEKALEVFTKSIMASPEQFDEVFEAILSEYRAAGADEVYKAKRAQYIKTYGE